MSNNYKLLFIQLFMMFIIIVIIFWLIRLNSSDYLEKRFKKYSLNPIRDNSISFINRLKRIYEKIRNKLSLRLIKLKIFNEYSKKYQKYSDKTMIIRENLMNYVSDKILCGILFILIILLSDALKYKFITIYQLILSFLVGFFTPDIYLYIRDKIKMRQIRRDMLKAIIIMNNSFKSGLSIMQAIHIVSKELEGPISEEFKKMYIDINFGLDMDLVFKRFATRVNTEDARYMATSLSVLNKTGGNIVQVFSFVEKSAFSRKKIQDELESTAASANVMFRVLSLIPIVLTLIIFILNTSFFVPLITTTIGIIILLLILIIYVTYIIIIRNIIKIKE